MYAVRYGESNYPPRSLLILSGNLAPVLALCKGRSKYLSLLSVMRRIVASGFRAAFVLSFRLMSSDLKISDKGSRFFDRDYPFLHLLAQRLTRASPSRASDQGCSSPSPMHLDGGQVDFGSHTHVPSVNVQSHAPSVDLWSFMGSAAAVSSQGSPVPGTNYCIGDFGLQNVSWFPRVSEVLGLVGSHFLGETQMQQVPVGDGTEVCHARSPTEVNEKCPDNSSSGSPSRRHAPVERESLPEICDPVPVATVQESR